MPSQLDPPLPMANLLDQLAAMTVVVSDTGDIDAIKQFTPRDATTIRHRAGAARPRAMPG